MLVIKLIVVVMVYFRITEWLRLDGTSGSPTLLLKQGHLELVVHDNVWIAFKYLQRGRLHNLSEQPMPVLSHPHSKKSVS